jgi:hypothetical protein
MPQKREKYCSIPDCGKPHYGNGLCCAHNARLKRYGDTSFTRSAPNGEPARFFSEVVLPYDGDDCLAWPHGTTDSGYGVLTFNGKKVYAHRLVCEAAHGPAPTPRHEAAHSCGNGHLACVTKKHLSWKTRTENEADKLNHGTRYRGSQHVNAKLTEDDVRQIRAMIGTVTYKKIAEQFGVSIETISGINAGRSWAWL